MWSRRTSSISMVAADVSTEQQSTAGDSEPCDTYSPSNARLRARGCPRRTARGGVWPRDAIPELGSSNAWPAVSRRGSVIADLWSLLVRGTRTE